ncbi:MAG: DUF433 domain-containing protein [Flavisolibacter sp.]
MENLENRIEINSSIMLGKPVIKGTRITVASILDELALGYTVEDVIKAHPTINDEDVFAALKYAASIVKNEKIYTTTL